MIVERVGSRCRPLAAAVTMVAVSSGACQPRRKKGNV